MFAVLSIAAFVIVFTLFLTAMTIGLLADHRRLRKGNKALDGLRREARMRQLQGSDHE